MSRKWERRLDRAISLAIVLLLYAAILGQPVKVEDVRADHLHDQSLGNHIASMHLNGPGNEEHYCVDTPYESLGPYPQGQQFAWNVIKGTLYEDKPDGDWDGLADNRVYFDPRPWEWDCGWMRTYRPNEYSATEIDYVITREGPGGAGTIWCRTRNFSGYGPPWDSHALKANVECPSLHFTQGPFSYHHAINHETGHVLGLADPPDDGSYCVYSVMHSRSYGCTSLEWPTGPDFNSVEWLIYR